MHLGFLPPSSPYFFLLSDEGMQHLTVCSSKKCSSLKEVFVKVCEKLKLINTHTYFGAAHQAEQYASGDSRRRPPADRHLPPLPGVRAGRAGPGRRAARGAEPAVGGGRRHGAGPRRPPAAVAPLADPPPHRLLGGAARRAAPWAGTGAAGWGQGWSKKDDEDDVDDDAGMTDRDVDACPQMYWVHVCYYKRELNTKDTC